MLSSRNNGGETWSSAKVCKVIIDIESCASTRKKVIPVVSSAVAAKAQVVWSVLCVRQGGGRAPNFMTRKQSHPPTHPAGEETRKNENLKPT